MWLEPILVRFLFKFLSLLLVLIWHLYFLFTLYNFELVHIIFCSREWLDGNAKAVAVMTLSTRWNHAQNVWWNFDPVSMVSCYLSNSFWISHSLKLWISQNSYLFKRMARPKYASYCCDDCFNSLKSFTKCLMKLRPSVDGELLPEQRLMKRSINNFLL